MPEEDPNGPRPASHSPVDAAEAEPAAPAQAPGPTAPPAGREAVITEVVPVVGLPSAADLTAQPYLIVLSGPEAGRLVPLAGRVVLGRRGEADVELPDAAVSRHHCALEVDAFGDVYLEDLGSANGTWVDEARVSGTLRLEAGAQIRLGAATLVRLVFQDRLEADLQRALYDAALRDGLTRLFNRRYLMERLTQEFAFAARHRQPLALLVMDLDHFKDVNDRLGHLAGDQVLRLLAQQLEAAVRDEDVCGRLGGEEFGVLVQGVTAPRALLLAERIRHLIARSPYRWQGTALPVTISIGLAGLPDATIATPGDLLARADEALYRAKRAGRNTTRVYSAGHLS